GDPPHPFLTPGDASARAHHLCRRRVAVPRPPGRRERLPHKGRERRRDRERDPAVASGRTHLDPAIQQRLIAAVVDATPEEHILPDDLTSREVEVLKLIAAGLSNAEIATARVVSGATVKTHVNHIFAKTGARDRAQAVR